MGTRRGLGRGEFRVQLIGWMLRNGGEAIKEKPLLKTRTARVTLLKMPKNEFNYAETRMAVYLGRLFFEEIREKVVTLKNVQKLEIRRCNTTTKAKKFVKILTIVGLDDREEQGVLAPDSKGVARGVGGKDSGGGVAAPCNAPAKSPKSQPSLSVIYQIQRQMRLYR